MLVGLGLLPTPFIFYLNLCEEEYCKESLTSRHVHGPVRVVVCQKKPEPFYIFKSRARHLKPVYFAPGIVLLFLKKFVL